MIFQIQIAPNATKKKVVTSRIGDKCPKPNGSVEEYLIILIRVAEARATHIVTRV